MSHERQRRLMELLDGALELPEAERFAFLDRECCDNAALRDEIYGLMETRAEDPDDALARPMFSVHSKPDQGIEAGREIGPYRVVRLLERGGMGAVYLAERADFEKQVALKIIRRGLDLDVVLVRRFHNERQILARLEHPHIARLHDGGATEDQLPYFVMEYVDGEPIDQYCRSQQLSIDDRIELFRKVCLAVQFAHRNLVVHRDLKPGNILINEEGEPKLLDFGIAKLLEQDSADQTVVTGTREGLMTPRYASPEQILGEPISTASDIYSLGVLLFELLTGVGPYRLETSRSDELARAVCDQQAERPSTAVRRQSESESVSDQEARKLSRRLKGDLDHIVLKALRKQPGDRYGSAQELAEDLRRHQVGLPVEAATGSWTYRSKKFVRRHWVGVAIVIGFLAMSTAFGIFSFVLLEREKESREAAEISQKSAVASWESAEDSEKKAKAEKEKADTLAKLLEDIFREAAPSAGAGSDLTAVGLLKKGLENIEKKETNDQAQLELNRTKLDLTKTLGRLFQELRQWKEARIAFERALVLAEGLGSDEKLTARANLASLSFAQGDYEFYESELRDIRAIRVDENHERSDIRKVEANLAGVLMIQGVFKEAEDLLSTVLDERRAKYIESGKLLDLGYLGDSHHKLASLYWTSGRIEQALDQANQALEIRESFDKESSSLASTLDLLGRIELDRDDLPSAEDYLERARGIRDVLAGKPRIDRSYQNLAELELQKGDLEAASRWLDKAELASRGYPDDPEDHWVLASLKSLQGAVLLAEGQPDKALPLLEKAYERLKEVRGPEAVVTQKAEKRWREARLLAASTSDSPQF